MASKTKGVGIVFLRKLFIRRGGDLESRFLAQLTPGQAKLYHETLPMSWVDIDDLSDVFAIAAPMLFPGSPEPLCEFARAEAQDALSGIYKIFLRFATVPMLVEQTAKLWYLYYEKGKARSERNPGQNIAHLIVEDYPDIPARNREIVRGYTIGTLELTGAKQVQGITDESNPMAWRWTFRWS